MSGEDERWQMSGREMSGEDERMNPLLGKR
jgi:hypothetical protein